VAQSSERHTVFLTTSDIYFVAVSSFHNIMSKYIYIYIYIYIYSHTYTYITLKVLKCGTREEWRRSVGPIV